MAGWLYVCVCIVAIDMESFGNMNGDTHKGEKIDFEVSSWPIQFHITTIDPY